jgi:hypothetical protein
MTPTAVGACASGAGLQPAHRFQPVPSGAGLNAPRTLSRNPPVTCRSSGTDSLTVAARKRNISRMRLRLEVEPDPSGIAIPNLARRPPISEPRFRAATVRESVPGGHSPNSHLRPAVPAEPSASEFPMLVTLRRESFPLKPALPRRRRRAFDLSLVARAAFLYLAARERCQMVIGFRSKSRSETGQATKEYG